MSFSLGFDYRTLETKIIRMIGMIKEKHPELLKNNEGVLKEGGFLCIYLNEVTPKGGNVLVKFPVGEISSAKALDYSYFSQEKAIRLNRLNFLHGHLSSYESRIEKAEKYGGAIVADKYILSFSGLPEKCDEALMLWLAFHLGLLTIEECDHIARLNNNTTYEQIRELITSKALHI